MIFKEAMNLERFKTLYKTYPYGFYKKEQIQQLWKGEAGFDEKFISKIFALYSPIWSTPHIMATEVTTGMLLIDF